MVYNRFYEYVELLIPGVAGGNTQSTFNFPDEPQIRNVPIISITVYTINATPVSGLTGTPLASVSQMQACFLTLYTTDPDSGEQKNGIDRIPILELNYMFNATADPHVFRAPEFVGQTVTWPKSFITNTAAGSFGNTTNIVLAFGIRYGWSKKVQQ